MFLAVTVALGTASQATLATRASQATRLHPLSGSQYSWASYRDIDSFAGANLHVHSPLSCYAGAAHAFDDDAAPTPCLDVCYEDPACHGVVTYEGSCCERPPGASNSMQRLCSQGWPWPVR